MNCKVQFCRCVYQLHDVVILIKRRDATGKVTYGLHLGSRSALRILSVCSCHSGNTILYVLKCLLLFGAESFALQVAVQKLKD